jgi:hypothetical protein
MKRTRFSQRRQVRQEEDRQEKPPEKPYLKSLSLRSLRLSEKPYLFLAPVNTVSAARQLA